MKRLLHAICHRGMAFAVFIGLGLSVGAQPSVLHFVDPMIGSEGEGRVFPGPSMPYGMCKPGPDCVSMPNAGWAPMPEAVLGFSQTHVSGTGGGQKYGNILLQPFAGKAGQTTYLQHRLSEAAAVGYYSCSYEEGPQAEVTADDRCALYRFRKLSGLFVNVATFLGIDTIPDKREAQQFVACDLRITGENELVGSSTVRGGWNNGGPYTVFFCLQSDVPFHGLTGKGKYAWLMMQAKEVNVKVGISFVSIEKARQNITSRGFDAQRRYAEEAWERLLSRIQITGNVMQNRMFYTALYHTMLMPVDRSGENPYWPTTPYYDDYYAIWDTYRTSSPLLTLIDPDRQRDIINSLLNIYRHEGYMPDARSGNCNGRTQGGSNAEIVVADAFAKGLKGIDYQQALQAMIKDAEVPPANDEQEGRGGLQDYNTLGYIPYGIDRAGSRTVEYSYDDWCIAQVARGLGRQDLYEKYLKRSENWRNLWRDYPWQNMRGFIMPKDKAGRWLDAVPWGHSKVFHPKLPYRPDTSAAPWYLPWWSTFFYEALSAEYSLSVPHDVQGLMTLCGGKAAFVKRLDTFFNRSHYNVANEPSFMTPYLYHWADRPERSSERIRRIITDHFSDQRDGLPGNDDSGAMSSWLVWNMLGLYPVAGQNLYLVGSPMIKSYRILLPNGKWLTVEAKGKWRHRFLKHEDLLAGGKLLLPWHTKLAPQSQADRETIKFVSPIVTHALWWQAHFVLNRQYRDWAVGCDEFEDNPLVIRCNHSTYFIPKDVVDHADRFTWNSPQKGINEYSCRGTFLFISRDALQQLKAKGAFVYDEITWRKIAQSAETITVKADVDGTEMVISTVCRLPWVLEMRHNPLGIDWKLEFISEGQYIKRNNK